jgi:biopolymer transport protein ExbD
VLFKASADASVGLFMRAIDTIRENGGQRLVIATDCVTPESDTP